MVGQASPFVIMIFPYRQQPVHSFFLTLPLKLNRRFICQIAAFNLFKKIVYQNSMIILFRWFHMKLQDLIRRQVNCFIHFSLPEFAGRNNPLEAAHTMLEGGHGADMQAGQVQ